MGLFCRLLGHKYDENDVCTRCGTSRHSQGLKFKKTPDKQGYVLTDARACTDESITVPAQYKRKPVLEIGSGVFAHRETPFRIKLHQKLRHIGSRAFADSALIGIDYAGASCTLGTGVFASCRQLPLAELPEGLTELPDAAFEHCVALTEVHLKNSVRSVGNRAFNGCTSLRTFAYDSQTLTLGNVVFRECTALESIRLPRDMTVLGDYLLSNCTSLRTLELPEGITAIGEYALAGCSGLLELRLPAGLVTVGAGAFCDCEGIETLEFPATLTDFVPNEAGEGDAMRGCTALCRIVMHPGVKQFPRGTLADCTSLTDIELVGGKSQDWRAIQKDDGFDTGSGTYVVHLINGRIRKGS